MEKLSKLVIKEIMKTDLSQEVLPLGVKVASVLFEKNKMAYSVNVDNRGSEILLPQTYTQKSLQEVVLSLTDLIAVLSFLEKTRLIVLMECEEPFIGVYYEQCRMFNGDQLPHKFHLSDDLMLTTSPEEPTRLLKDDMVVLEMRQISATVVDSLGRYLNSSVLPTKALKEFVERGYRTQEEELTRKGLRYSIISMIIAVVIAIGSLLGSVWVSNKHGVSTITPIQFDSLLHSTRPVLITNDTIVVKPVIEDKYGKK